MHAVCHQVESNAEAHQDLQAPGNQTVLRLRYLRLPVRLGEKGRKDVCMTGWVGR